MVIKLIAKFLRPRTRPASAEPRQLLDSDFAAFVASPGRFLRGAHRSSYEWPQAAIEGLPPNEFLPEDMYFVVGGQQVAYVQRLTIIREDIEIGSRRAIVGHIAVEVAYERRGIGRALVRFLQDELSRRYAVRCIDFDEDSRNWTAYPAFFAAIGTIPIPVRGSTRPRYRLSCSFS